MPKGRPQVTQNSMDTVADRDLFIEFRRRAATFGVPRLAHGRGLDPLDEFGV
jgi:argininosuccinate lyase